MTSDDGGVNRRNFLQAGTVALIAGLAGGPQLATAQTQVDDTDLRSAPLLVGAEADRPDPGSGFFEDKIRYAYVYQPTDAASRWVITEQDDDWTDLSADGIWSDTDGDGLAELPNHGGVSISRADVSDLRAANLVSESGTITIPAASQATETITFRNNYRHAAPDAGLDVTGGLTGNVQDDWAGWNRDANGNITGMDIAYRNETTGDITGVWSVFGVTTV